MNNKEIKLTDKQKMFISEYLIDFNATQAAIRAGYSKDTANRIGSENLSKLDLYINEELNKRLANNTEDAYKLYNLYKEMIFESELKDNDKITVMRDFSKIVGLLREKFDITSKGEKINSFSEWVKFTEEQRKK